MNRARAFAYVVAAGAVAAFTCAANIQTALADPTLLSANGPLSGSDTAIIVGGTIEPTPSTAFAQTAEVPGEPEPTSYAQDSFQHFFGTTAASGT